MAKSTLEQAIRNAIEVERAAERFYRLLADSTTDDEAVQFLLKIAVQEMEHAKTIEEYGKKLTDSALPERPDDNVEVVETSPDWAYVDDMSLKEAMQVALENEQSAEMYYDALADSTEGDTAKFFKDIANLEAQHVSTVQKLIDSKR